MIRSEKARITYSAYLRWRRIAVIHGDRAAHGYARELWTAWLAL